MYIEKSIVARILASKNNIGLWTNIQSIPSTNAFCCPFLPPGSGMSKREVRRD